MDRFVGTPTAETVKIACPHCQTNDWGSVEVHEYEPVPEQPQFVRIKQGRTLPEIAKDLGARVKELEEFDYFGVSYEFRHTTAPPCRWPVIRGHWRVMAWVVKGSSEGWYLHVGMEWVDGKVIRHETYILGKSFDWDNAWAAAKRISQVLDC
jgi:hypothetical protein